MSGKQYNFIKRSQYCKINEWLRVSCNRSLAGSSFKIPFFVKR